MKIQIIDGFEFRYERDGSEARISLTNLAKLLGYKNNQPLRRLARRHAKELAELSALNGVATVATPFVGGQGATQIVDELYFNYHQAYYLMMRSETEVARKLAVRFTKAFFELMGRCWKLEQKAEQRKLIEVPKEDEAGKATPKEMLALCNATVASVQSALRRIEELKAATLKLAGLPKVANKPVLELPAGAKAISVEAGEVATCKSMPPHVEVRRVTPGKGIVRGKARYTVYDFMHAYGCRSEVIPPTSLGRIASALYRDEHGVEPPFSADDLIINGKPRRQRVYGRSTLSKAMAQYKITDAYKLRLRKYEAATK
jgi:hypothetical protein